jgi:hypothetical protein
MKAKAREIGGNNLGPFVEKYLSPSGVAPPQAWCAAFVSWCLKEASKRLKVPCPLPYLIRARSFLYEGRKRGWLVVDPAPGDIVVWSRGAPHGPFGHVGLVASRKGHQIGTIEGNRTPEVRRFSYDLREMPRLLGFVRLPA